MEVKLRGYRLGICILIIVFIVTFAIVQLRYYTERNFYKERYVNHLYTQVDTCIYLLQRIIANTDDNSKLDELGIELLRLDATINDGELFMDDNIYHVDGTILQYFNSILGNELDEEEKEFLKVFNRDLEDVKLKLHSDETGQENPDLSISKINEILAPLFDEYHITDIER